MSKDLFFPNEEMGNLREQTFDEIWSGAKGHQGSGAGEDLREKLLDDRLGKPADEKEYHGAWGLVIEA